MSKTDVIKEIFMHLINMKEAIFEFDRMTVEIVTYKVSHRFWQGLVAMMKMDWFNMLALARTESRYIVTVTPANPIPEVIELVNGIFKELEKYLETKIEIENFAGEDWEWFIRTSNALYVNHDLPWVKYPQVIYENDKVVIAYYYVTKVVDITDEDVEKYRTIEKLRNELHDIMEELEIKKIDLGNLRKEVVPVLETMYRLGFMIVPKYKKAYIEPAMSIDDLRKLLDTTLVLASQQLDKVKKLYLKHILIS